MLPSANERTVKLNHNADHGKYNNKEGAVLFLKEFKM